MICLPKSYSFQLDLVQIFSNIDRIRVNWECFKMEDDLQSLNLKYKILSFVYYDES